MCVCVCVCVCECVCVCVCEWMYLFYNLDVLECNPFFAVHFFTAL